MLCNKKYDCCLIRRDTIVLVWLQREKWKDIVFSPQVHFFLKESLALKIYIKYAILSDLCKIAFKSGIISL